MGKYCEVCGNEKKTIFGNLCKSCKARKQNADPAVRAHLSETSKQYGRGHKKEKPVYRCEKCGREKKTDTPLCKHCAGSANSAGKTKQMPEGWREHVAESQRGRQLTEEHKRKLSEAHEGVPLSREHAEAIQRGQLASPNREKMGHWRGKHNPYTREAVIRTRRRGKFETSIEKKVKDFLIESGFEFEQERYFRPIGLADFYLPGYEVVIECDGTYWHDKPGRREKDSWRDAEFSKLGIATLRLSDDEINDDWENCVQKIMRFLGMRIKDD